MVEVAANPWVGPVLALSPSSIEDWQRCRRLYRTRHLLNVPSSEPNRLATGVGLEVHRLLELVHAEGCCGDLAAMSALVHREMDSPGCRAAGRADREEEPVSGLAPGGRPGGRIDAGRIDAGRIEGYLARHATRCPGAGSSWSGHELTLARYHRRPPRWVLTARIDAVWARGAFLEGRDYKTGRRRFDRVVDDLVGRLQVWLLAPLAAERGLRLRLSYEHLSLESPDDPDPYEPEDEDLVAIEDELCALAVEINAEIGFSGCGDAGTCRRCTYESICAERIADPAPL